MSYKILIADDEPSIRELVRMALEEANLTEIIEAENGRDTIEKAAHFQPSLILLDWMMPEMDGLTVCRTLKMQENTRNIPIIMLTAKSEESDIVLGLEMGAVDYITKPFSMRELMARVKANIRRTAMQQVSPAPSAPAEEGLVIDTDSYQVKKSGKPIDLTQREYELLAFLSSHPGKVFSRSDLMEQVWNYGYVGDDVRTVDVTVRRLREKIEDDPANPAMILTRRGVGYYFAAP